MDAFVLKKNNRSQIARYLLTKKQLALAFLIFVSTIYGPEIANCQQNRIDSLLNLLHTSNQDTNKVAILNLLAGTLEFSYPDSALNFVYEALELSQKLLYKKGIADSYYTLSFTYGRMGDFDKAMQYSKNSLKYSEDIKDKKGISLSYNVLGNIHSHLGNYQEALNYYLESLKIKEELKDTLNSAFTLTNVGLIHYYLGDYEKALQHYHQGLSLIKTVDDFDSRRFEAITYNNIGNSLENLNKDDEALDYYFKSIEIKKELGNIRSLPMEYNNIGVVYSKQNKHDKALEYFYKALKQGEETSQKNRMASSLLNIGMVYQKEKKYIQALNFANKSLLQAKETKQKLKIRAAYELIIDCYEGLRDYERAYRNLKLYNELSDSLFNEEKSKQIVEIETKYQTEKKEAEIELLSNETRLKESELERQKLVRNLIIAGGTLIFIIVMGAFNRYKFIQKTKRQLIEKERDLEVEKFKEIDQAKSSFFANISHEFRTPLTLILGLTKKLIETSEGDHKSPGDYQVIQRNAERLQLLINQLLDISKLEAGAMSLKANKLDLVAFIKPILASFSSLAESKNIEFEISIPEKRIEIYFDPDKLEKIVNNLLSNAFKFTPPAGKVIACLKHNQSDSENDPQGPNSIEDIEITIEDTGKGIPEAELDNIFNRFYQLHGSNKRTFDGTGIGLALTKELVELHHGKISVTSRLDCGTTFKVKLLMGRDHLTQEEINDKSSHKKEVSIKLFDLEKSISNESDQDIQEDAHIILVVEDNQDLRKYIKNHLENNEKLNHHKVIEAGDGKQGLKKALDIIPDIVISDLMMQEMDGLELCQRLKTNEKTCHIPVIMLTAKADQESKMEGLEVGADAYIAKPFDADELILSVANMIDRHLLLKKKFSQYFELGSQKIIVHSIDRKFLEKVQTVIDQHMAEPELDVNYFSRELAMSRSQFYRKLKGVLGQSPNEFIREMRLIKASQLIGQNFGTIAEVAYAVGFNNLSYFTKCFKEKFDQLPSEYEG